MGSKDITMDLSVIIVCYRGWDRLTGCLESLSKFSGESFSMEVVVVDNNSGDDHIEILEKKYSKFRFIRNRINGGYSNGCNLGVANSTGESLLILNPDTVVTEHAVERLLDAVKTNPRYYIISCRQIRNDGKESKATGSFPGLFCRSDKKKRRNGSHQVTGSEPVIFPDWVSGSVMMMRREIFEKLNGFDEDFWMYSEDVDLCRRARNIGGEVAFYKNITVEHNHGGSSRIDLITTSLTKCEVQKSRHLYIHKHRSGIDRIMIHSIMVLDNLLTAIISGFLGLVFFFIPVLFVRFLLAVRLVSYYADVLAGRSWMSRRSVNYKYI